MVTKRREAAEEERSTLDVPALEWWLWEAACQIRGPLDAPKFKDYILPLIFLKRLSDVFEDELAHLSEEFGDLETTARLVEQDHKLVRFFIPESARWPNVAKTTKGLGQYLTDAVRAVSRENPRLSGVIDVTDFNATTAGQRIVDDGRLASLVQVLNDRRYRLGLDDVEPDILGRAYEYLLRKFAEGQGQSAGEFYTPREVGVLMSCMLDPEPGETIYDPCCGSGGLLIKCHLRMLDENGQQVNGRKRLPSGVAPVRVFGQEINPSTFAMARMNAFIHDMEAEVALGDSMHRPAFTEGDGRLRQFNIVTANPMWNQDFRRETYENDGFGRFRYGIPPASNADWAWLQHMAASLLPTGRMAVVLDTGAPSRGSTSPTSRSERDIRARFVQSDLVECVVLLPENLFYNNTAPGVVILVNRRKRHPNQILIINAYGCFSKGTPKNVLGDSDIRLIHSCYRSWKSTPGFSRVVSSSEVEQQDFNLSPALYVPTGGQEHAPPFSEALEDFIQASKDQRAASDTLLSVVRGFVPPCAQASGASTDGLSTTIGELVHRGILAVKSGYGQGEHNSDGEGVPHLRPFNVTSDGRITLDQIKYVCPPKESNPCWLQPGDVVFNNTNSEVLVGKTAYFDVPGRFVISNHMTFLRVLQKDVVNPFWLAKVFLQRWRDGLFRSICRRHVNQASVSLQRLKGVELAIPPAEEQNRQVRILTALQESLQVTEKGQWTTRALYFSVLQELFSTSARVEREVLEVK